LMCDVVAIVICSESALALVGALGELDEYISNSRKPLIYANMPLVNPQGFMRRVGALLEKGALAGVIDINKPELHSEREQRLQYARFYNRVLSSEDFVSSIDGVLNTFDDLVFLRQNTFPDQPFLLAI